MASAVHAGAAPTAVPCADTVPEHVLGLISAAQKAAGLPELLALLLGAVSCPVAIDHPFQSLG